MDPASGTRAARLLLIVAVLLAACGGQPSSAPPAASEAAASDASPAPTASETEKPVEPSEAESRGEIVGKLGGDPQLEGGCAWIDTGEQRWQVLYPRGYRATVEPLQVTGPDGDVVARGGDTITVKGAPAEGIVTICQVGPVWRATEVSVEG